MFDPVFPEHVAIEIIPEGESDWVELEDVQIEPPLSISRGIQGTSQRDRVASTGTMTFVLDNSERNSLGLLGLYSLNHVNTMVGWNLGIKVRCRVTFLGIPEPIFVGTISSIVPTSGKYLERKVSVSCVDWMEEAALAKVSGLEVQVDKRSDEVFSTILAEVEKQPEATQIGFGGDEYPYSLDNMLGEEVSVMSEFQRLAQSELGYIFIARDGTLIFQGRHRRPNLFTLSETLTDEDISNVEATRGREEVINRAEIQAHPRRVDDSATTILFTLASTPRIERSTSLDVDALYRDPDAKATRVGGIDMVDPLVSGVDYLFNTLEDGTGIDITGQLSVTATFGGNSAEINILNNGPKDGYLILLQCRGCGVYDYETVVAKAESLTSKTRYGENVFSLDMPYQDDLAVAEDAAAFVVQQGKTLLTQVKSVTFCANREERLLKAALQVEIGSRVRVEETVTGTAGVVPIDETDPVEALEFFIQAIRLTIQERGVIFCTWTLAPADAFHYWILERAGYTELGETTRLAYGSFIAGWVVNESEVGITTRVNS